MKKIRRTTQYDATSLQDATFPCPAYIINIIGPREIWGQLKNVIFRLIILIGTLNYLHMICPQAKTMGPYWW